MRETKETFNTKYDLEEGGGGVGFDDLAISYESVYKNLLGG